MRLSSLQELTDTPEISTETLEQLHKLHSLESIVLDQGVNRDIAISIEAIAPGLFTERVSAATYTDSTSNVNRDYTLTYLRQLTTQKA